MAALLALGLGLQLYFFRHYPQPYLFGDPAGYYDVGERLQGAVSRLRAGEAAAAVFADVRGLFFLFGVGGLFAVLDGLRPQGFAFFRDVMAAFNTLAMFGAYLLGRRLSGGTAGGLVALLLAATYPTFAVQTGRLYPDPVTSALFVFAAWAYAEAIHRSSPRWMALAAMLFGAALLVRAQILEYLTLVVAACLVGSAPAWARRASGRRLAVAFVLGLLPTLVAWAGIRWAVGDRDDVVRMGQVTFRPTYPFGFWQQLDTDGWTGPYRFKQDPFYREMAAEAQTGDPDLLRSRRRQWAFTARYVARRGGESVLLVLDNAYRLYDRPANDYKWDYPFPYGVQVLVHRAIVVFGLAGMALVVAQRGAFAGVFLVPLSLALLHGLVFPWPRYNVPGMPILIAAAGALVGVLVTGWSRSRWRGVRGAVLAGVGGAVVLVLAELVRTSLPMTARALAWAGALALAGAPFLAVKAVVPGRRGAVAAAAGFGLLAVLATAHSVRDRRWHEVATRLGGDVAAVEQDIHLTPEALATLRRAPEAYVVFDLTVPRGDLQGAAVRLGQVARSGAEVLPTMPRLRETTAAGGRDRRGYPQWWALRLDPAALPATAAEPLTVRLDVPVDADVVLRGDRFADQSRVYEGPSFGDWPNFVALKIEYDADYRIPVRRELGSAATESRVVRRSGETARVPWVHRIRVLVPGSNEGWMVWEASPPPSTRRVAAAFAAYSGTRGEAELAVDGVPALRFPLGSRGDFDIQGHRWRLCHRAEAPRQDRAYGAYVLVGPPTAAGVPLSLTARYRAGLSLEPMFFVIDRRRPSVELGAAAAACAPGVPVVDGAARVLDGTRNNYPEDTGRWTVAAVY